MIEYVVNFDEMEETLSNILSVLKKKKKTNIVELKSKELDFLIPPLKGRYEVSMSTDKLLLKKLFIILDGYNSLDDIEIFYDGRLSGRHTFTNSVLNLNYISPLEIDKINFSFINNSGLYRNLKINLILIKEDN